MGQYYYWHVVPENREEQLINFVGNFRKAMEQVCSEITVLYLVWLIDEYPGAKIALIGDYSEENEALEKKGIEPQDIEIDKYVIPTKYIKVVRDDYEEYFEVEKYGKDILLNMIVNQEVAGGDFEEELTPQLLAYAQFYLSEDAPEDKIYLEDPVQLDCCGDYDDDYVSFAKRLNEESEEEEECKCEDNLYSLAQAKHLISFNNGFDDTEKMEKAVGALNSTASAFCEYANMEDPYDSPTCEMNTIYDYGLSVDLSVGDKCAPYIRWQFSWGGPSDELRIYADDTIEYVFLDWFVGIGFDVTGEDWAEWAAGHIKEYFGGEWPQKAIEDNCQ